MSFQETIYKLITYLIFFILTLIKQFSKCNSFKPLNDSSQKFPYRHNVAVPGYPHRQLRGFRREEHTAAHVLCLFEPIGRVTQSMGEKAWVTNRKRIMSVGIAVDSSVKGMMRSKFPTIIPSFLVLSIPMNLPKSRKRVRQRAPRFREFHLHSTKRNFS